MADALKAVRHLVPVAGTLDGPDSKLDPRDRAEVWQLTTTYDRQEGNDAFTGKHVPANSAVVVVAGAMSESHMFSESTWKEHRQEIIETITGLPILSTIVAKDLIARVSK